MVPGKTRLRGTWLTIRVGRFPQGVTMMTPAIVCSNCSAYFSPDREPPTVCPLCDDDRGALPRKGQSWTTSAELRLKHHTVTREHEPGLLGIGTEPPIMPGHRALLVQTSEGNVLWDCISLIDEAAIEAVKERGPLCAIAVSHPTSTVPWLSGATLSTEYPFTCTQRTERGLPTPIPPSFTGKVTRDLYRVISK